MPASTAPARYLAPDTLARPGGHYSHACVANGMVYVSGQLPIGPDGTKLADAPFEAQARQVLDNVAAALAAAGSGIDRLVQVRVYVDRMGGRGAPGSRGGAHRAAALRLQGGSGSRGAGVKRG